MKYKSELIHEILEQRGHEKSSLHYQSECVESWVDETKGAYPKLCDYESEWLNYVNNLNGGSGEDEEPPIGEFPYETVTTNNTATVNHVVPFAYKTAILKGNTDENLQSVKMPVLTTKTGINLLNPNLEPEIVSSVDMVHTKYIKASFGDKFSISTENSARWWNSLYIYDSNKNLIVKKYGDSDASPRTIILDRPSIKDVAYVRFGYAKYGDISKTMLNYGEQMEFMTYNGDYKSNILTVNEDVTLRSNGDVCDELDLLTGKLTQRIDEDGEVLVQEVVKTVDLTVVNQDGEPLSKIKPIEGTMHVEVSGTPINPTAVLEVPVEAITQNLNSFIEGE